MGQAAWHHVITTGNDDLGSGLFAVLRDAGVCVMGTHSRSNKVMIGIDWREVYGEVLSKWM